MCKDRVSYYILKENIRHMEHISQFHWISHLVTDRCDIRLGYRLKDANITNSSLEKNAIDEIVNIDIYLNTKQFTPAKTLELSFVVFLNNKNLQKSMHLQHVKDILLKI